MTAMLAVCARAALIGRLLAGDSVVLQVPLDELLGGPLRGFAEMELDTLDPAGETEGKPLAIAGVHRRHRVLPDIQALEPETPRHLLLDSALPTDERPSGTAARPQAPPGVPGVSHSNSMRSTTFPRGSGEAATTS